MALLLIGFAVAAEVATREDDVQGPVALVRSGNAATPIAGFQCSGVVRNGVLLTAAHCLTGEALVVHIGSLCQRAKVSIAIDPRPLPGVDVVPSAADIVIVDIGLRKSPAVALAAPRAGERAVVYGFGVAPALGRPTCEASSYIGSFRACAEPGPSTWCIDAPADAQLCGGSSGAPVYGGHVSSANLVGVLSGGPPCGQPGLAVVATLVR